MSTTVSVSRERMRWQPETLAITAARLSLLVLTVGFAAAAVLGFSVPMRTQMIVYLVGMVALNLPHGGYEHFTNLRHRGLPFGARYVGIYLLAVAGFVALFFLAPVSALGIAFATAVAKGGHGDLHVMDAVVGSDHLKYRPQRALAALVRGGAVMILPLFLWRDVYIGFSQLMVSMFDPGAMGAVATRIETGAPVLLGGYAVALVAHLLGGFLTGGFSRDWLRDVGETGLLVAYFTVVPVVISIGLYFPLWYSMRQSGRSAVAHRAEPDDGLSTGAIWAVFVAGAFMTGTVAAALYLVAPNPLGVGNLLGGLVAFYTIFICVVAMPHVVVGQWLDRDRGIWYVP
ncbi:beta-carotene 15,15'-dioxygenase, Brp/Blh family [Halovenus sp. WSH3]|uniref:Probable beta-carotene 15,15'-dioxygenase n=1 Tax=Halovenus carboxidivorans TaxID=2692199 RepID=A0A6B0T179_9EURY|nr:Brp/Blh family beta-carotene 15,15'-dioxygenase [Halovenus carboxidivorans]MXR51958.1 beta-carotene 15,15'-dioxygenase, Brp/Blh family [Halovenus carboxidivorans]